MKTYQQSLLTIFLGLLIIAGASYAWTGPVSAPPAGNTDAPINVGSLTQYKSGALGIGGLFRAYGQAIFDGNVGIGTASPGAKLEVVGTVKADGLQLPANAGAGKILTSDASGNASWQTPILEGSFSFLLSGYGWPLFFGLGKYNDNNKTFSGLVWCDPVPNAPNCGTGGMIWCGSSASCVWNSAGGAFADIAPKLANVFALPVTNVTVKW